MKKLSIGGVLAVLMLICGGAFLGGSVALAQGITSGTLSGTVADATGAVIAGAKITATNPDTNAVYLATTGSSGSFSLSDLPVGIYVVKIEDQGFSNLALNDVHVDSNHTVDLGIQKLQPGGSSITIEVTTAQGLLETTEAQISTTFDTEQVANLPLGGGFDEMTLLVPGIVATHDNNFSNTNGTGFSSNGQRGRSNNFEIDGQSNNDNSVGGPQFFFGNEEAISQVEVISNNFSAAYGRNMGSVVNYITKSGTNQIHGSAFYKYSGDFTSSLATAARRDRSSVSALQGRIRVTAAPHPSSPASSITNLVATAPLLSGGTSSLRPAPFTAPASSGRVPRPLRAPVCFPPPLAWRPWAQLIRATPRLRS